MPDPTTENLLELDRQHLIHPLHNPTVHQQVGPHLIVRGSGCTVWDRDGHEYVDAIAGLWNTAVGHGRAELASAAADQIGTLAYYSNYTGYTNEPAIKLAAKLAQVAYPNLTATFFTSGGAESNESAFKMARYFWKLRGRPAKTKIVSRHDAYHGVTESAMSATGISAYHTDYQPLMPGFLHVASPNCYHCEYGPDCTQCGIKCAQELEDTILREGPDTVAAFIAEPVQGAGGVIIPPPGYFPRIRQICDEYNVLLIADEVITGFGRTGAWFALDHWDIRPDIMSFAKAVTSGYLPLGGIMVSKEISDAINTAPPTETWMHAYTYSGHPTCCALGLRNLEIIEREDLVGNARRMGNKLAQALPRLKQLKGVGDVRNLGLIGAVELVENTRTHDSFPPERGVGAKVLKALAARGVLTRAKGDIILIAPPLVIQWEEIETLIDRLSGAIVEVMRETGLY